MVFDAHCDFATVQYIADVLGNTRNEFELQQFDFSMMKSLRPMIQTFAFFLDPEVFKNRPFSTYFEIMKYWDRILSKNDVLKCRLSSELDYVAENEGLGAIYSLEGMDFCDYTEDLDEIDEFCRLFSQMGVRFATLTWNHSNSLATGVGEDDNDRIYKSEKGKKSLAQKGLTRKGKAVIGILNKYGIVPDVSHASLDTCYDICCCSDSPVIASHSNARAICNHKRNLSDTQLKMIEEKDGLVGINMYPPFIVDSRNGFSSEKNAPTNSEVMRHFYHIVNIIGTKRIALGCDFSGIETTPLEIKCTSDIYKISELLSMMNFSSLDIDAIMGENLLSLVKKTIQSTVL